MYAKSHTITVLRKESSSHDAVTGRRGHHDKFLVHEVVRQNLVKPATSQPSLEPAVPAKDLRSMRSLPTSLKNRRLKCFNEHQVLLKTIKAELAHLLEHGIDASSLDYFFRLNGSAKEQDHPSQHKINFFQIYEGKLYLHHDLGKLGQLPSDGEFSTDLGIFGSHTSGFVSGVCRLLHKYPDLPAMRLMASNQDDHTEHFKDIPVFVPWKVKGSMPIAWPSRGDSVSDRSGLIGPNAQQPVAWSERISKAFFAGNPSDHDNNFPSTENKRRQLQGVFDTDPESRELMNVSVNTDDGDKDYEHHHFYPPTEQANWKYQLIIDGHAARGSYMTSLITNSLNLKEVSPYYQFFEPALEPYKHFVPVDLTDLADPSAPARQLKAVISWARTHDDIAKQIADEGGRFVREHLTDEAQECYFLELLLQYQELMHFDDKLPKEFSSSPDLCNYTWPDL